MRAVSRIARKTARRKRITITKISGPAMNVDGTLITFHAEFAILTAKTEDFTG
jgi:hypothetical protein